PPSVPCSPPALEPPSRSWIPSFGPSSSRACGARSPPPLPERRSRGGCHPEPFFDGPALTERSPCPPNPSQRNDAAATRMALGCSASFVRAARTLFARGGSNERGIAMKLRQLFDPETSTYTYLLLDERTGRAALVDPVREQLDRDLALVRELGVDLAYVLETHVHADHVTAAGPIADRTGAETVASAKGAACAMRHVRQGDVLPLGDLELRV